MPDWDRIRAKYEALPVGGIILLDGKEFIKMEDDGSHHIEECLIEVATGKFKHYSRIKEFDK